MVLWFMALDWDVGNLDSIPNTATDFLFDLGQITESFGVSVSPLYKTGIIVLLYLIGLL